MSAISSLIAKGGPPMIAILLLSVFLYSRCFKMLFYLRRTRRTWANLRRAAIGTARWRALQRELRDYFRHQRMALGAMIAAAPLLGLLGTVGGMVKTFESLSDRAGSDSMESLARGISEVLVATESGLIVALPALMLVWLAHLEMLGCLRQSSGSIGMARKEAS